MALREELIKKIERKRREISDSEAKIRAAVIYIQALEDTLKLIPADDGVGETKPSAPTMLTSDALRSGSKNDRARQILRTAGKPLHISKILDLMGEKDDQDSRNALVGSLGAYVRDKKIFTRPEPNTFGLIEFEEQIPESPASQQPPRGFGADLDAPVPDDDVPF